ncbi:MAG: LLM class flavin-dependent oxidoreductase [Vicinamibacterales bacterium]
MIPFSVLDLAPVLEGGDAAQAFRNSVDLARHAEASGYERYWLAEHHNMPGIASAATSIVIGHVAAATSRIRVGSGGIMLPNHSPLVVAEQFGTLASLFPGRIDLGLGRAPGTDPVASQALRRSLSSDPNAFGRDVVELLAYFRPAVPGQRVQAVPGAGLNVPVWILGSSIFGSQVAAELGLPYAFASHFAPALLDDALALYRSSFQPSIYLDRPHVMVALQMCAADTDAEADLLFTSVLQAFRNLRRGNPGLLPPPRADVEATLAPHEREELARAFSCAVIGGPDTVRRGLQAMLDRTRADEMILACQIFDHAARLRSYEIAAQARAALVT